ncbi:hypothetical protein LCGC14_1065780 [marine sediment metagenome]|uniref:Uncharacterized protein n=1 Tax=marine sediment metagenome TaxID=412755 RepID=A0A0F9N6R2_9ZZZZ
MTDHEEITVLLEKAINRMPHIKHSPDGTDAYCLVNQALILLRTAQEPVSNETEVRHPIDSNGKANYKISYCYYCGQHVKNQLYCQRCGSKLRWPARPDCTVPEQPNCEGCEFFKHNNKYEHCWRYTQLTSVCKLRQDHKEQPPANELTDWLRKTISGDRHEKGDKELQAKVREACDVIDQRQEQPSAGELNYEQLIEDIAENIGVGIHTSLRKALDSKEACVVWDAISNLGDGNEGHRGEWKVVVDIVAKHTVDFIIKPFIKNLEADLDTETQRADKAENQLREGRYCQSFDMCGDAHDKYEAKLKAKDKLLYAYESVNAPVNPLLSINKDLLMACKRDSLLADIATAQTPTGDLRNRLTEINILRLAAIQKAKQ